MVTVRDISSAYPEGSEGRRAGAQGFLAGISLRASLGAWGYPGLLPGGRLWLRLGMTECGHGPSGLPREHPESYHSFMWNNFFKHIDIHPANTHILDGNAADLQAECDAFEEKIQAAGGIELFVGGELDSAQVSRPDPAWLDTCCLKQLLLCASDCRSHSLL